MRRGWDWLQRASAARACLALLAAVMLLVVTASPALAHAVIVSTDPEPDAVLPASPARITMTFSEPIAPGLSDIEILDMNGQRVDADDSTVDASAADRMSVSVRPLAAGTYTVAWHNVSTADGHALRGSYVFYVGTKPANAQPSAAQAPPLFPSPAEPVLRALALLGAMGALGSLVFQLAVAWPASAGARIERRTRRLAVTALLLFAIASVAHAIAQAMNVPQLSFADALRSVVIGTRWGRMWVARMMLLAAIAPLAARWLQDPSADSNARPMHARRSVLAMLTLLAGALLTMSLASHGVVTPNVGVAATMSDWLHLLGAGVWAGALASMALAVEATRRMDDRGARRSVLHALATRFSALGVLGTGTLAITGLYSAWAQVTVWSALDTAYGRTVLIKSALFAILVVLGAINLRVLRPRLSRMDTTGHWLLRIVIIEVGFALLAVTAAGVLTSLEPARQVASRNAATTGVRLVQQIDDTQLTAAIQPGTTGNNQIAIDLADQHGRPVTDATQVVLRVQSVDQDLGAKIFTAASAGDGRYAVDSAQLTIAGRWQLEVDVVRPGTLDAHAAWRFDVASPGMPAKRVEPNASTGNLAWAWEVIILGGLLLIVTNIWWSQDRPANVLNLCGSLMVLIGVVMWYGLGHTHTGTHTSTGLVNPIVPTAQSIAQGRTLYQAHCVGCHGVTGAGDGDDARGLDPSPADLVTHVPLHSDGELYTFIATGFPRSAMVGWRGQLSDEQMWNLVNYLRTLSASPPVARTPAAAGPDTYGTR